MADNSGAYRRLAEEFYAPASLESVLRSFSSIDRLLHTGELSGDEASQLKEFGFRSMRSAATGDPVSSRGPILDLLLVHCLTRANDEDSDARFARHRYREYLRDWLNDLPEPSRSELRDEILGTLLAAVEEPYPEPACWVIAVLGHRGPGVSEALWKLADTDKGETGDVALDCLAELGIPSAERPRLLEAVCERARVRCTTTLNGTMWRLADPRTLDTVEKYWLKPDDETFWPKLSYLIVRMVAEILIARPDDPELHDRVWAMIVKRLGPEYRFIDQLVTHCDSPEVIPFVLNHVFTGPDDSEQSVNRRYMTHHRLEECVRPRQLEGWLEPVDSVAAAKIRNDAARDTGTSSRYISFATRLKEASCNALLSMADPTMATASAFEEFVGQEEGTYTRHMISELLACFRIEPLPYTAVRWVTERIDVDKRDSGDHFSFRTAAGRVLRSAGSREAFEHMASFGMTFEGQILRETTDAIIDLAVNLALNGDRSVVNEVVDIATQGVERHHRVAAAAATMHLASLSLLSMADAVRLTAALEAEHDQYELGWIVAALGYLPGEALTPEVVDRLLAWSRERDTLGWRSLETLARHDRLIDYEELLVGRLGLRPIGSRWDLDPDSNAASGAGYVLGLLFSHHPDRFLPAVCAFVRTRDWVEAATLVYSLDFYFTGPHPHPVNSEVVRALVDRIHLWQSESGADLDLFDFLGKWDFTTLTREPWEQVWDDWMADARVALADSLGVHGRREDDADDPAVGLLLRLTGDGAYAVRRSAYRSLSRLSETSLESFCLASSGSSAWDQRRRGAEGCGWLTPDTYEATYQLYESDVEGPVRSEAKRVRKERRDRLDAERFLGVVLECRGSDNAEILGAWRYGLALQQLGDDSCLERLRKHCSGQRLPSHIRHWMSLIEEGLEKKWREVTQKWPEPWLSLRGTIQEGPGTIHAGGSLIRVRYTLWKEPALAPAEYHSWGGTARTAIPLSLFSLSLGDGDIEISNGERGRILITKQTPDRLTFCGQGPYPTRID